MADSDSDTSSAGLSDGLGTSRDTRTGRLLHRFYEPLILLRVLDPTRGKQNYHSPADQGSDNSHHFWGKFLDHLSWMCDYKQGGATVSAIAAEKTNDGPTFWLAAPKNSRSKVQPHLEWILNQLDNLPAKNQERVEQEILTCCIEFSRSKVKNYSRSLCTRIRRCTEILAVSVQESDIELLKDLARLESLQDSHLDLCSMAFQFRRIDSVVRLSERHSGSSEPSPWSDLRHIIGRLGSWEKAVKILIRGGSSCQHLINGFRVQCLDFPPPIRGPIPDSKTTLDSALKRMLPVNEKDRLEGIREIFSSNRVVNFSSRFLEEFTKDTFKPRIHAEVLVLDWFYHKDLDFVDNYRYVGCSKPSCYCCDLYMRHHPGEFVRRASHGNLWPNWRAPIPPLDDGEAADRHTSRILNAMNVDIRKDALHQIESRSGRRQRVPDSTTGMSASVVGPERRYRVPSSHHSVSAVRPSGSQIGAHQTSSLSAATTTRLTEPEPSLVTSMLSRMRNDETTKERTKSSADSIATGLVSTAKRTDSATTSRNLLSGGAGEIEDDLMFERRRMALVAKIKAR